MLHSASLRRGQLVGKTFGILLAVAALLALLVALALLVDGLLARRQMNRYKGNTKGQRNR